MRTVYVIGYPGVGKSSTVAAALAMLSSTAPVPVDRPVAHTRYTTHDGQTVWEMGRRREAFSGTDALAMSVQPIAVRWVTALQDPGADAPDVLVGEGDRLATRGFLDACPNLTVVHLTAPLHVAQQRAAARARALGRTEQDARWMRGRVTKVDRLAAAYPCVTLDAQRNASALAADLAALARDGSSPPTVSHDGRS